MFFFIDFFYYKDRHYILSIEDSLFQESNQFALRSYHLFKSIESMQISHCCTKIFINLPLQPPHTYLMYSFAFFDT